MRTNFIVQTNQWIQNHSSPGDLIHLPAGSTPIPIYKQWEKMRPEFLNSLRFQQVDEVITGNRKGLFENFF